MLIIGLICNCILLFFLARTSAYKLIKSRLPQNIVEDMYAGDSETAHFFTAFMNFSSFIICVVCGYMFLHQYYMEFLPFVLLLIAKKWKTSLAKAKVRMYVMQKLFQKDTPNTFQTDFVEMFSKLMKMIDRTYVFSPIDYPQQVEITTAYLAFKNKSKS
jgi:hypothetical protein